MATTENYLSGKEAEQVAEKIEQAKTNLSGNDSINAALRTMERIQRENERVRKIVRQYENAPSVREARKIQKELDKLSKGMSKDIERAERALRDAESARKAAGL